MDPAEQVVPTAHEVAFSAHVMSISSKNGLSLTRAHSAWSTQLLLTMLYVIATSLLNLFTVSPSLTFSVMQVEPDEIPPVAVVQSVFTVP